MTDLVLLNGRIWTGDGTYADTAVVRDRRFAFVGSAADVNAASDATTLDLGGRFLMPGFTDSHAHLLGTGFAMRTIPLKGVTSVNEAATRVAERASVEEPGTWLTGAGWDQNLWPDAAFPTAAMLDAVAPHHPVMLDHTSGHCVWVNSLALHRAGITRDTAAPAGGAIDIDERGEPTGILRDNAARLIAAAMPRLSQTDRLQALESAIEHAHQLGVTGVHAMNVGRGEFQALHALNDNAKLTLRTRMFLAHERLDEWIERNLQTGDGDSMLRIGGVKFFADGALGSLTAWMFEPYATEQTSGFPLQPIEDLERDVGRSLVQGLAPAVHAIGDRANHEVLNILERLGDLAPDLPRRIEHAQVLRIDDVSRFARLGVTASTQPIHATADWQKVDREWGDRGRLAYAFAALEKSGANLAFGSDTPVEDMHPIAGVHAAATRRTADGLPPGGWYPDEQVPIASALRHYTTGPAVAVGEQATLGRIAVGQAADFTVLSGDPFALDDPADVLSLAINMTAVNGEVVYRSQ